MTPRVLMPLYVGFTGYASQVLADMLKIVDGDGGLGTSSTGDPGLLQVTYKATTLTPTRQYFDRVVNGTPNDSVVVYGLDNTALIPTSSGQVAITSLAGVTYPPQSSTINIFYDVTGCGGSDYYVVDLGGIKVDFEPWICLFHELSHGYHYATGTISNNPELQAEQDENVARADYGCTVRNQYNHIGGCGAAPTTCLPPSYRTKGKGSCLIVTAALGSAEEPRVRRLREMRDSLVEKSTLGAMFFESFEAEYYRFSPLVAAAMRLSPALHGVLKAALVSPVLDVIQLLESHVQQESSNTGWAALVQKTADQHRAELLKAGLGPEADSIVLEKLRALRTNALQSPHARGLPPAPWGSASIDVGSGVDYFLACLCAVREPRDHIAWAICEPLEIWLSALVALAAAEDTVDSIAEQLARRITAWLVHAPTFSLLGKASQVAVAGELRALGETFLTASATRQSISEGLVAEYGNHVDYDLAELLRSAEFLGKKTEPTSHDDRY